MKSERSVILRVFLLSALAMVASAVLVYLAGHIALTQTRAIVLERTILQRLERVIRTLDDAETGQRGYLLTGDENFLQPYKHAQMRLRSVIEALRGPVAGKEVSRAAVDSLERLARDKMAELEGTLELHREGQRDQALAIVRGGHGKDLMDRIRAEVGLLDWDARYKLDRAETRSATVERFRSVLFTAAMVLNAGFMVWAFLRIALEIRSRRAATEEVVREKELVATTLASIGDGVIVTDEHGRVRSLNAEAERLTGWMASVAAGEDLSRVFRVVHEETRAPVEDPVRQVFRSGHVVGLANHSVLLARDGTETPIDDSASPIQVPGGPLHGVVLVFRDFTIQKEARRAAEQAREDLARANARLEETVGERTARLQEMVTELQHVSYSITHDMRAPLRAMSGFAQMLLESSRDLSPESQDYCRRIVVGAGRLDGLIQDALSYSRAVLQEAPLGPVELSELLQGLLETYPNFHPAKADIAIEGELPVIWGNASMLTQCFANLIGNAVKFVLPGTRPRVRVRAEPRPPMARIWVEDNGIGIPAASQGRLFGMFQKLDDQYEGTGIGLAIVRKVVERMGGRVGVESEPGKGSRFWVELRLAAP